MNEQKNKQNSKYTYEKVILENGIAYDNFNGITSII